MAAIVQGVVTSLAASSGRDGVVDIGFLGRLVFHGLQEAISDAGTSWPLSLLVTQPLLVRIAVWPREGWRLRISVAAAVVVDFDYLLLLLLLSQALAVRRRYRWRR